MSDLEIRRAALELASWNGGTPEQIVARAASFYEFLSKAARPGKPKEQG